MVRTMEKSSEYVQGRTGQTKNKTRVLAKRKRCFKTSNSLFFDNVRIHYWSQKPVQFYESAYVQGNQRFSLSSQERCMEHEAGHAVQQKQDRGQSQIFRANGVGFYGGGIVQRQRWQWSVKNNDWMPLQLVEGERKSPKPDIPGVEEGQIKDTAITVCRLLRAQKRRMHTKTRKCTRSDMYMHIPLGKDNILIHTPFASDEREFPYMRKAPFPHARGPFINGRNRPQGSTSYLNMTKILDSWCKNNSNMRQALLDAMLRWAKTTEEPNYSPQLFEESEKDIDARRAANYFIAILIIAEPHETRANPDGGKLARACLRIVGSGKTFTEVFASDNGFFPQALKNGNVLHRKRMDENSFHEDIPEYLSDSSSIEEDVVEEAGVQPVPCAGMARTEPLPETDIEFSFL